MTKEQQRILEISLCSYLPYGIKMRSRWFDQDGGENSEIVTPNVIYLDDECISFGENSVPDYYYSGELHDLEDIEECKMVLRPLSDLTKPITVNGETFVPVERMKQEFEDLPNWDNINPLFHQDLSTTIIEWAAFNKLTEWMFDVYNLINQQLAISVHDLPENPYEK
jgi:hypothetical protein